MCTANPNCVAYYYKVSECHEANGMGLIGAPPDLLDAMTVYMDRSLNPGIMTQMKLTDTRLRHTHLSFKTFIVNCAWSAWSNWDPCSKTCGGGTHQRTRSVGVVVANGGSNCTGNSVESDVCNTNSCPGKYYIYLCLVY